MYKNHNSWIYIFSYTTLNFGYAENRIQCRPLCNLKTVQDILMERHRNINQH